MKGLEKLKKKSRPDLVTMAEGLDIKVSKYWNRTKLATVIIEKNKLKELEVDEYVDPQKSRGAAPELNPEFEAALARDDTESIEGPPESPQVDNLDPDCVKAPGGRTMGLTDEKARVERLLKNHVPDPVFVFALKKCFSGWQLIAKNVPGIKLSDDEAKLIGIPTTNLMSYYFPNFKPTPVLEMWVGLYMGLELVIGSRFDLIKASRANTNPVLESDQTVVKIIDRLRGMSPDRAKKFADMLGIVEG